MKKFVVVLVCSLFLIFPLAAQNTGDVNKQYETITWNAVERTSKYEINIERLNEKGKWIKVYGKSTTKTTLEVLLEPGSYRVSVTTFNILGKKTVSEWTNFYILNENTPYLFNNYYEKSSEWKVPVLYINHKNVDLNSVAGSKRFITAEKGFAENSFFIKGKNIFSQNTTFSLVPSDWPLDGGKDYNVFYNDRKEVPLTIIQRDTKKSGVYVSYNPELLYSGYYSLVARNGSEKDSYGIFVSADRPLEMTLDGFEQDARYKVNALVIKDEKDFSFSIVGRGFTSSTKFTLIPVDNVGIEYPYASSLPRSVVPVNLKSKTVLNASGSMKLDLVCNTSDIKSGYYYVHVENDKNDSIKSLMLAKTPMDDSTEIQVNKITSKYNKKTKDIDFTVSGKNLNKYSKITLISEYSEENDGKSKIDSIIARSLPLGTKLYSSIPAEKISQGNHAFILETMTEGSKIAYFNIDKHYKSHYVELSEEKAEKLFLRPEEDVERIDFNSDIQEKVIFTNDKIQVKARMPYLIPYIRFNMSSNLELLNSGSIDDDFRFELDLFNFRWLYFDTGIKYNPHRYLDELSNELGFEASLKFSIPVKNFTPFFGIGIGYNLVDPAIGFNPINLPTVATTKTSFDDGFFNSTDIYMTASLGLTLIEFYDIRYNLELHNYFNSNQQPYFKDMFTIGVRIPIRRTVYSRNVLTQGVTITKGGEVHAADYKNLGKVTYLNLDYGVTEVNGFVNHEILEKVVIPETLVTIGPAAFKNCDNLSSVLYSSLNSRLKTISEEAFANDKKISVITIPVSVTTIEENAFAGWTEGQTIRLDWDKSDTLIRKLPGLNSTKAMVIYKNGALYRSETESFASPFTNVNDWGSMPSGISVYRGAIWYNGEYHNAVEMRGVCNTEPGSRITKNGKPILINQIKDAKSVKFKAFGDNNKYMFLVVTSDSGYFASEFTTPYGKNKEYKINLNDLKARPESAVQKLDKSKIIYAQIVPCSPKGTSISNYFFDFEVDKK